MQQRLAAARLKLDHALASLQERREAWQQKKAEWKAKGHARAEAWREAKAEWEAAMAQHRAGTARRLGRVAGRPDGSPLRPRVRLIACA